MSMRSMLAALCSIAGAMGVAQAAKITVTVLDEKGEVVTDAVVEVGPGGSDREKNYALYREERNFYQIVQKDLRFTPHILVVPRGATVTFPNQDTVRHHVYSFSPAKKFELALYGRDENRAVTFDSPGIVAIGCNIHDDMQAYIYVSDSQRHAQLTELGQVTFSNLAEGEHTINVWHPRLKPRDAIVEKVVQVGADASLDETITVSLRPAHRAARASYN